MKIKQKDILVQRLYQYFHTKYGITKEALLAAIEEFGMIKGRLETYFEVSRYEQEKKPSESK